MRTLLPAIAMILFSSYACTQGSSPDAAPTEYSFRSDIPASSIHKVLYDQYDQYKEASIASRRFKHADIVGLIQQLEPPFSVETAAQSIEGRDIYLVKAGTGSTKVLLWSQMHGDESTATMALMDIFNFFTQSDEFDAFRQKILSELTLYFIPMLNPDGAEAFRRRNALDIDLNRDALRLQSPEAALLKNTRDRLDADWGFNLHDQNRYYGAGMNSKIATISFLAPAYNYEKDINTVRANSMKLIAQLNAVLQEYIPGQVARYNDDFEPRAFGDNIQKWGTSTILIESGGLKNDPEKQQIRRLNFVALLSAFQFIAGHYYEKQEMEAYEQIPFNESGLFHDLLIREVEIEKNGHWHTVDIAFRREEKGFDDGRSFYYQSQIRDIGDLSVYYAYDELMAKGYRAFPGKVYNKTIKGISELKGLDCINLLERGYTDVKMANLPKGKRYVQLPLKLIPAAKARSNEIRLGRNPSLLLKKNGEVHYAIINGFVYDLLNGKDEVERVFRVIGEE